MLSQVGAPLRAYIAGGEFIANRDLPELGVKIGERIPWRDLGIHEVRMHELWRANIVDCAAAEAPALAGVNEAPTVTLDMPGTASAETASRLTRAERRALRRQG